MPRRVSLWVLILAVWTAALIWAVGPSKHLSARQDTLTPQPPTGITSVNAILRDRADFDGAVVAVLPAGTSVTILETGDTWHQIRSGEAEGFIWAKLVQLLDPVEPATSTPTLSATSATSATPTPTPALPPVLSQPAPQTVQVSVTLGDLQLPDMTLRGLQAATSLWVPLPSNLVINSTLIDLVYVASPLLREEYAALSVLVNDEMVTSFHPIADGNEQHILLDVSSDYLYQGLGFQLKLEGFLPITDDICERKQIPGQWLKLLNTSSITLAGHLDTTPPRLETLAQSIVVQGEFGTHTPTVFVLPEPPDAATLNTAAQIAARLGRETGTGSLPFEVRTGDTVTETDITRANLVIVGLPETNLLLQTVGSSLPAKLEQNTFFATEDVEVPDSQGVIQTLNSPWNPARKLLVVSAGSPEGLLLAGEVFAADVAFEALTDAFRIVKSSGTEAPPTQAASWLRAQTSLEDLGVGSQRASGVGVFDLLVYLNYPVGWQFGYGSQFVLHLSHSLNLEPGSYVSLYINEIFVGTTEINAATEQQTPITFNLPVDQLNASLQSGELDLRFEVANLIMVEECEQILSDMIWTQVESTSFFSIQPVYISLPNLQAYPYPFVNNRTAAPVGLVVPPDPHPQELSIALSTAAMLGSQALEDFEVYLVTAEQASGQVLAESHLIVLGERARNPLIDQVIASVPPLVENGSGMVREVISPWNEDRMVLLAFGETEAAFAQVGETLFGALPLVDAASLVWVLEEVKPTPTGTPGQ